MFLTGGNHAFRSNESNIMRKQINTVAVTTVPEGKTGFVKLLKKRISPVTITITVAFDKVNENGTLSGAIVSKVTGLKGAFVVAPVQGGGSLYCKVETLDGIKVLADMDEQATAPVKRKLF